MKSPILMLVLVAGLVLLAVWMAAHGTDPILAFFLLILALGVSMIWDQIVAFVERVARG